MLHHAIIVGGCKLINSIKFMALRARARSCALCTVAGSLRVPVLIACGMEFDKSRLGLRASREEATDCIKIVMNGKI